MGAASWIAIGRSADRAEAFALEGGRVTANAHGPTEADALSSLGVATDRVYRIGDGSPDTAPCTVLPGPGHSLPVIIRDQPPDVLGGWARLWIAGFLARHEGWDGVICAEDGDVTHWIHLSADEVVSFSSFLTLRLVAVLGGSDRPDPEAIADSLSRPERLAAHLRQSEVAGHPAAITGHLVGAELAASRVYWLGQQLALITPKGAASGHAAALGFQEVPFTAYTPDELIPDGLAALAQGLGLTA